MEIKKAVIPAAGLGTRLLPATKSQPKEMLPIVDRPAIQYVVEEAINSGIEDILIITGRGKRTLEDHFDRSLELEKVLEAKADSQMLNSLRQIGDGADLFFIRQKEPKGLGHAILCAERHIGKEPFAVLLGDDIFVSQPPALAQMMEIYQKSPGVIVAIQEVPDDQVSLYGIVSGQKVSDSLFAIDGLVEKPSRLEAPSNLAIVGRYIFPAEIFPALKNTHPDKRGEIQLTDAITLLLKSVPVYGYFFTGKRYDIGNHFSYLTTNVELALKRPELKDRLKTFLQELLASECE